MSAQLNGVAAAPRPQSRDNRAEFSIPLYVAGLVVTLAGILAVGGVLPDSNVASAAALLAALGFAFSGMSRWLKVPPAAILATGFVLIGFIAYSGLAAARLADTLLSGHIDDVTMITGLMWISVVWSWILIKDDLILLCCLFSAALVGYAAARFVDEPMLYFLAFFAAMLFMIVHKNSPRMKAAAEPASGGGQTRGVLGTQLTVVTLCGLVIVACATLLGVALQMATEHAGFFQALKQLTTGAAQQASEKPHNLMLDDAHQFQTGMSSTDSADDDVNVMHYSASDHEPHYLLGRTYDFYAGTSWYSTLFQAYVLAPGAAPNSFQLLSTPGGDPNARGVAGRPVQTINISVQNALTIELYCPDQTLSIQSADFGSPPRGFFDGRTETPGTFLGSGFTATFRPLLDTSLPEVQNKLRHDGTNYPPALKNLYLSSIVNSVNKVTTPADLAYFQSIVRDVVATLPADRRSPFDVATALKNWISERCTYSLDVPAFPADTDTDREFLQNRRIGYCDQFASSLAVLCRVAGIPSRVATGFAPGTQDAQGYQVTGGDKHAWTEVYFPGDQWQIFDATEGTQTDAVTKAKEARADAARAQMSLPSRLRRMFGAIGIIPVAATVLAVVIAAYVAFDSLWLPFYRRIAAARSAASRLSALQRQYLEVTALLSKLGIARRASETPNEYAERALPLLDRTEALLGVQIPSRTLIELTQRFVAAHYAGVDMAPMGTAVDEFRGAVAVAIRRRILLKLRNLIMRGKHEATAEA